jgi:hypothetical protein
VSPSISKSSARNALCAALAHYRQGQPVRTGALRALLCRSRARRQAAESNPAYLQYALSRLDEARMDLLGLLQRFY